VIHHAICRVTDFGYDMSVVGIASSPEKALEIVEGSIGTGACYDISTNILMELIVTKFAIIGYSRFDDEMWIIKPFKVDVCRGLHGKDDEMSD